MNARHRFLIVSICTLAVVLLMGGHQALAGAPSSAKRPALVFLIAGQSNAHGCAPFSPESNKSIPRFAKLNEKYPTIPGSTAKEIGLPTTREAYPRSFIWMIRTKVFEPMVPGGNPSGGFRTGVPQHGIELPVAWRLEKLFPNHDKYFIKFGPVGSLGNIEGGNWNPAGTHHYNLFNRFMAHCRGGMADLKKRYSDVRVIGLYWDQGESDRAFAKDYDKNLRALAVAFRKQIGIPDLTILVRKHLYQYGEEAFAPIMKAQVDVARDDPDVHLLDIGLGSNEANFKAWAWTMGNGHLSSKAYLALTDLMLSTALKDKKPSDFHFVGGTKPKPAKVRVYLLGGQSNMNGAGKNSELAPPYNAPQPDVKFWHRGTWVPLAPGFHGSSAAHFGPEVSFGRAIKDANPGDDIYLIKYAYKGTALYNDWAPGGHQHGRFISTAKAALTNLDKAGIDFQVCGMLWMQGESDAEEGKGAEYEANMRKFIADMRARFRTPKMPFAIGRVMNTYGRKTGQAALVRAAQQKVAETMDYVEWFDTDSYALPNQGHYHTKGLIEMGKDFAKAVSPK